MIYIKSLIGCIYILHSLYCYFSEVHACLCEQITWMLSSPGWVIYYLQKYVLIENFEKDFGCNFPEMRVKMNCTILSIFDKLSIDNFAWLIHLVTCFSIITNYSKQSFAASRSIVTNRFIDAICPPICTWEMQISQLCKQCETYFETNNG